MQLNISLGVHPATELLGHTATEHVGSCNYFHSSHTSHSHQHHQRVLISPHSQHLSSSLSLVHPHLGVWSPWRCALSVSLCITIIKGVPSNHRLSLLIPLIGSFQQTPPREQRHRGIVCNCLIFMLNKTHEILQHTQILKHFILLTKIIQRTCKRKT